MTSVSKAKFDSVVTEMAAKAADVESELDTWQMAKCYYSHSEKVPAG